jgi:transcriptional regulator with XRE-family HTH domain
MPANTSVSVGHTRIYERRVIADLSQEELSTLTGISVKTIRRLEVGEIRNPGIRTLFAIAGALRVPLHAVIEDEWWDGWVTDPIGLQAEEPGPGSAAA